MTIRGSPRVRCFLFSSLVYVQRFFQISKSRYRSPHLFPRLKKNTLNVSDRCVWRVPATRTMIFSVFHSLYGGRFVLHTGPTVIRNLLPGLQRLNRSPVDLWLIFRTTSPPSKKSRFPKDNFQSHTARARREKNDHPVEILLHNPWVLRRMFPWCAFRVRGILPAYRIFQTVCQTTS